MTAPLLQVHNLKVRLPAKGPDGRRAWIHAVDDVSFDVHRGQTVGLVGESGSGKTTIARALMRLTGIESGRVLLEDRDLLQGRGRAVLGMRRQVQLVFQDPYSSLDPSMSIGASIAEPLRVHFSMGRPESEKRVGDLLDMVGLSPGHRHRYPYEFSGGQRQRIAIARALAAQPDLVVLDEAVSALDVSTQQTILQLLEDLQEELGVAYLFISHDLTVMRHISDQLIVLYLGRVVEYGPTEQIFSAPQHPYTRALLSAVPIPDPAVQRTRQRIVLAGELPDPTDPPSGCPFHTRCPEVIAACRTEVPPRQWPNDGWQVVCHLRPQDQVPGLAEQSRKASLHSSTSGG